MANGINMKLMIGPAYPIPVPEPVLAALTDVQVVSASGEEDSGFELKFTLSKRSILQTLFLISGQRNASPGARSNRSKFSRHRHRPYGWPHDGAERHTRKQSGTVGSDATRH